MIKVSHSFKYSSLIGLLLLGVLLAGAISDDVSAQSATTATPLGQAAADSLATQNAAALTARAAATMNALQPATATPDIIATGVAATMNALQPATATPDIIATGVAATLTALQPATATATATPLPTETPDVVATHVQATVNAMQNAPLLNIPPLPEQIIPFSDPAFTADESLHTDNRVIVMDNVASMYSAGPWVSLCYDIQPASPIDTTVQTIHIPVEWYLVVSVEQRISFGLGYHNGDFTEYGNLLIGPVIINGRRTLRIATEGTFQPVFEEFITDDPVVEADTLVVRIIWEAGVGSLYYGADLNNLKLAKDNIAFPIPESGVNSAICMGGFSLDVATPLGMEFIDFRLSTPAAPDASTAARVISTPTPRPTATRRAPTAVPTFAPPVCTTTRLQIGCRAEVYTTDGDGLRLRASPNTSGEVRRRLSSGTVVYIMDGPFRANGYTWWEVHAPPGVVGYAVQAADGIQTLIPIR